jgi:hypothetical protein
MSISGTGHQELEISARSYSYCNLRYALINRPGLPANRTPGCFASFTDGNFDWLERRNYISVVLE